MFVRRNLFLLKGIFTFSSKDKGFLHHPIVIDKHELEYEYPPENKFFGKNAVVITHKPTSLNVTIKDGEDLEANKKKALKMLKEKIDLRLNKEYYEMKEKHHKIEKTKGEKRKQELGLSDDQKTKD